MHRAGLLKSLPKSDGTSSTNYGPKFEFYSIWMFIVNCCRSNKEFCLWFNEPSYIPWDDIVAKVDDVTICIQLKHSEKFDKKKKAEFLDCMEKRESIVTKHKLNKDETIFVFYSTSPDDDIKANYKQVKIIPDILDLIITNREAIYRDYNNEYGATYICMKQNNITSAIADVNVAFKKFIGEDVLTEDNLNYAQTNFLSYLDHRYYKLIDKVEPFLTHTEVKRELAYVMLEIFKPDYFENRPKTCKGLKDILEISSVVVINHKVDSKFKTYIWSLLKGVYPEINQFSINNLWRDGKIHMPIESSDKKTDDMILRALEIGKFEPKVIILRPTTFTIEKNQTVITLLQNVPVSKTLLEFQVSDFEEKFKVSTVNINSLLTIKNDKLHPDSFHRKAKIYFQINKYNLKSIVEAHDEFNYINEYNLVNNKKLPALLAAIKIKKISIGIIEHLIKLQANVNALVDGGFNPLFYAVQENRLDIVKLLLQHGADPNLANEVGDRPLYAAIKDNQLTIIEALIANKADRAACDKDGVSPLFMAYNNRHYKAMQMLLMGLSKPNAANVVGSHILHQAAEDNNLDCLECVINYSHPEVFVNGDRFGKSPLDIAKEKKHCEFYKTLSNALEKFSKSIQQQ